MKQSGYTLLGAGAKDIVRKGLLQRIDESYPAYSVIRLKIMLHVNAELGSAFVKKYCRMNNDAERLLNEAVESMCLSMRAYNRILKVARTIADLAGEETISGVHIAEAIQYRELDQKYWR